jgi:tetratricopeptide (TPR) repeat protein
MRAATPHCGPLAATAALALACAAAGPAADAPPLPAELREPRVLSSRLDLTRVVALSPEVGDVTDVALLADGSLGIGGTGAALRMRGPGDVHRTPFPAPAVEAPWDVVQIDLDGDGSEEIVNRGGNGHPVWVRDASGRERWRNGRGVDALRVHDLDADGGPDFVLGMNGAGGIRRLDAHGHGVWSAPARNVWQLEIAELDASSPGLEILHSQASGKLVLRAADGRVLREIRPPVRTARFALLAGAPVVWIAEARVLHRLDLATGERRAVPLPVATGRGQPHAARVRLAGRSYDAVLLELRTSDRAVLALVSPEGQLDYLRVFDRSCAFLSAWRARAEGALVLGCAEDVVVIGAPVDAWSLSIRIRELAFGTDSPQVLEDRLALAGALRDAGRLAEAEAQLTTVQIVADPLPALHPLRPAFANAWALLFDAKGWPERAQAKLDEALRLLQAMPAADTRLRSDVHHNLGRAAQRRSEWQNAEAHYRRSLALLGEESRAGADAADTAYGLAQVLLAQGQSEEALSFVELAIEADTRSFGPEHPEVAEARALRERILAARRDAPAHRAEQLR